MANVKFNAKVSYFVNYYFSFGNVEENETDVFNFLMQHYDETAHYEIVPLKMTNEIIINVSGVSVRLELCDDDEFLNTLAAEPCEICEYQGIIISSVSVFGTFLYRAAVWANYPNCFVYCATFDDMKKQIDFLKK